MESVDYAYFFYLGRTRREDIIGSCYDIEEAKDRFDIITKKFSHVTTTQEDIDSVRLDLIAEFIGENRGNRPLSFSAFEYFKRESYDEILEFYKRNFEVEFICDNFIALFPERVTDYKVGEICTNKDNPSENYKITKIEGNKVYTEIVK